MFGFGKRPANTPEQPESAPPAETAEGEKTGFFGRLLAGLSKTRETLAEGLGTLLLGKKVIDQELLDELETRLLTADVGIKATAAVLEELTARIKRNELADSDALYTALKDILRAMLKPSEAKLEITNTDGKPFVILMVGVNGVGKTTTIGKLAKRFQQEGRSNSCKPGVSATRCRSSRSTPVPTARRSFSMLTSPPAPRTSMC
jgi:fused signal recognition particle receptor